MWNSNRGPEVQDLYRVGGEASSGRSEDLSPEWRQAEAFRRTGIFGRAAKFFRSRWEQTQDPKAGWRYAHCLRKTGLVDSALSLLRELIKHDPEDPGIRDELVWAIYEGRLSPAREEGKAVDVVAHAKEMVAAGAEGAALKLAVFAVMAAAKTKGQWSQVSCWCDLLDPSTLSAEARGTKAKRIPSDRERWYFAKLKALVKLEEWHEAELVGKRAAQEFPDNEHFVRWWAHALAGLGRVREAIELLRRIGPEVPWYTLADLAKYSFDLEEVEESWQLACRAALAPGQTTAKVNLWELMSRVSLALEMNEAARQHLALSLRIRQEKDWPLRPHHRSLIAAVFGENGASGLLEETSKVLYRQCRSSWGGSQAGPVVSGSSPAPQKGTQAKNHSSPGAPGEGEGWVTGWDAKRPFAFIEPCNGSGQIFVLTKDLPPECQRNRAPVRYRTILQFDKRKNRESLRAVEIQARAEVPEEWEGRARTPSGG